MRNSFLRLTCAAVAVLGLGLSANTASAACTKLGFSVNDYGKDGPTRDAKELLDKYIAKWAAEKGIAKYTTGKKEVTCELFLNFIVFDEHTCKAEATVCWDGSVPKGGVDKTAGATDAGTAAEKPAKSAAVKPAKTAAPVETGSTDAPAAKKEEAPATAAKAADAPKSETAPAAAPAAKDEAPAPSATE